MTEQLSAFSTGVAKDIPAMTVERSPRHMASVGNAALEGFALMEAVRSPWEPLRERMRERVTDQDPAIDAIVDALDASIARSVFDTRPRANLAFLGPTGVGKSETAKSLAEFMSNDGSPNLIKINCSEYSNGHEVANLIGSPLGYVGSDKEPLLSKQRIEKNGTVVLFDEIEKGSPALYDLMLQIMGDGEVRLGNGNIVYFKNTFVIMTSNLGAEQMTHLLSPARLGFRNETARPGTSDLEGAALEAFKGHFRTEFLNRIDKQIVFQPLSTEGLGRVLDTKLGSANLEYEYYHGAKLSLSEGTRQALVHEALEQPHFGARPVVRAFENHVQSIFGRYLGAQAIPEGTHVKVFRPQEVDVPDSDSFVFASMADPHLRKKVSSQPVKVEEASGQASAQDVTAEETEGNDAD